MGLELLRARPEEADLVLELVNKHLGMLGYKDREYLGGKTYYFAMAGDLVVGLSGLRRVNGWLAEQVNTLVLPEYRGRGFGNQISKDVTEMAWRAGYSKVYCTVNILNTRMTSIKQQQGWAQEGLLRNHFGAGRSLYIFSTMLG